MRQTTVFIVIALLLFSCGEKLLEKPDNLIAKEKMMDILTDMAVINAAKNTNISVFRQNDIDPTQFLFDKYGIDSVQFVESDRYYASQTQEYVAIYEEVEARLSATKKEMDDAKAISDSLLRIERERKNKKQTKEEVAVKDSLP